jgi:hypothetical protein
MLDGPRSQSNHKIQMIWKGREGLLCYSPTLNFFTVVYYILEEQLENQLLCFKYLFTCLLNMP